MLHKPVLTKEVLEYLHPQPGQNFIDGTIGQAGHALLILEKNKPDGKVLGIDLDQGQIENSRLQAGEYKDRLRLVHDSYANMKNIAGQMGMQPIDGILLDLGYSSWQLADSKKGFSFQNDEVLDMRYNSEAPNHKLQIITDLTAAKIVNEYREDEIEKILDEYGEEKFARKIAQEIVKQRKIKKIETTFDLKKIIERAVPRSFQYGRINAATKTFQALRIAVNQELESVKNVLPDAVSLLAPGGRLVVISFHSLEDRLVKEFFKLKEKEGMVKILTPKPVTARDQEVLMNSRSRSAKLRAIEKI